RGVAAGNQSRGGRFDVAFDAGNLTGEKERGIEARLPGFDEHGRTVDVRVAVHHAEAHELRLLQAGNEPQHTPLLAPFQLRLEADEAVMVSRKIILPELDGRVWLTARPRIYEADRLHRSEPQRIFSSMRHHFDRQAPLDKFF